MSETTLGVKRLYSLGDYKNITFDNVVTEVPEEIASNDKALSMLRLLQILEVESAYQKYVALKEATFNLSTEETLKLLDELKTDVRIDFAELFRNGEDNYEDA